MAWEILKKSAMGGRSVPKYDFPVVRINKGSVSFNEAFCATFGINGRANVLIMLDKQGRRIGMKVLGQQDEQTNGYTFSRKAGREGDEYGVACVIKSIGETFPEAVRHTFRAVLNQGEHVIEVDFKKPL